MRSVIIAISVCLLCAPTYAAAPKLSAIDKYEACLIGTALIEQVSHGNKTTNVDMAFEACKALAKAVNAADLDGVEEWTTAYLSDLLTRDLGM